MHSRRHHRQNVLLDLVSREALRSQEALRQRLRQRGIHATQATISRDIKELGLVKRPGDRAYQRSDALGARVADADGQALALARAVSDLLQSVDRARQVVVVRTEPGQAQPLALAIDRARLPDILGTVAGDDTILIVARDDRRAASLVRRFSRQALGDRAPVRRHPRTSPGA
jgi:transcriptional regulator of arginine metabolism